ncbi:hypothetical protein BDP27DRAFT_1268260 [Rhodocollybia butyracea]|uniref:RNI-like protein n=1 Tax=Rhodocollybia butyracea TaxID=206335 RepID=A0A9P5PPA5_9AGAR|nr:hypothetical protein BDP27DRAFT_1268260 [Rhodocollybia butyracea]
MFSPKQSLPPKLSPSSKSGSLSQIDCMDRGLRSLAGAKHIIELIRSRRTVTKLILGHNLLSDDGCVLLFTFLSSSAGRKYPIAEINLNRNNIGNRGLAAIATYLANNTTLHEIFLQDNVFTADPGTVAHFAYAINCSRLRLLSLTTNRLLSDDFVGLFFPALCSQHLQELHLSAIGLTRHAALYITDFITSADRCRLHTFKCNGNDLAFRGVRSIVRAIEKANYSLTVVEMYANNMLSGGDSENTDDDDDDEAQNVSPEAWKGVEKLLKQVLGRNTHLKKETGREAVQLLVYSRTVLLRPKQPFNYSTSTSSLTSGTGFAFRDLPMEIQLYILSFLSPILSTRQRVRIYTFASSSSTLPPLLPFLTNSGLPSRNAESAVFSMCVPDPSVSMGPTTAAPVWTFANGGGGCAPGKCMGTKSLLCHRELQRMAWLEQVGCLFYDPETALESTSS